MVSRPRRVVVSVTGVVAAALAAVVAVVVIGGDDATAPPATVVPTSEAPASAPVTAPGSVVVPASSAPASTVVPTVEPTLVASFTADVAGYDAPDGTAVGVVPAQWHGRQSVLPVIDEQPGWLHVRLAQRPNGSTAWVRRSDVELATTPFRVEIDVATMRLRLYELGEELLDAPVGIGTEEAPTAVGNFFVAFMQEPPDTTSGWGPFVIVTSSHSETISDFQMSGDAIAAIHGPLGAADAIGETGARVSHGCIRMHLDDLDVLRQLPAGTPIDIIDSSASAPAARVPVTLAPDTLATSTDPGAQR